KPKSYSSFRFSSQTPRLWRAFFLMWNDLNMSQPAHAIASFTALPLNPATLANLQRLGYLEMTPIQAASLPPALLGQDIIAQAKTGSGKTAAFALTLLA